MEFTCRMADPRSRPEHKRAGVGHECGMRCWWVSAVIDFVFKSPQQDQEFVLLENQLPNTERNHLLFSTVDNVQKSIKRIVFIAMFYTVLNTLKYDQDYLDLARLAGTLCMMAGIVLSRNYISRFPSYIPMALFIFNGVGYFLLHLLFQTNHKEHFNSFLSCCYLLHYFLCTLTPSKRHQICLIFSLTVLMHLAIAMYGFGEMDNDLVVSGVMSITFFDLGLETHQGRLSQMYQMILENKKLVEEKQKIMQQFPHPILILPQKISELSKCYPNDQFEKKIKTLNQKIKELDKVQVTVNTKVKQGKDHCERQTLLQYLEDHQEDEKNLAREIKRDAIIECRSYQRNNPLSQSDSFDDEFDYQSQSKRNYNIKSINVEWKGFPSVMHVFIDTTDIINLETAKSRIKMQRIMFASASHEFRTPLNAIINSFNFIKTNFEGLMNTFERVLPERIISSESTCENIECISQFLRTGSTSSMLMMGLVEDILNLSKIDNGTFTTVHGHFHIPKLLEEVHSLFGVQCESKGIELLIECNDDLEFFEVLSDANRIRQVLLNLVSNSVKFTFSGFIKIKAGLVKTLNGSVLIEFRVQDTGTGIKKEDQECLFKLFGVIGENGDLNPNGCGLGLTISKKYVERLDGEIRVESVYGEGTEMIFSVLPKEIQNLPENGRASISHFRELPIELFESSNEVDLEISEEYFPNESGVKQCKYFKNKWLKF
ncbi:unnamed protein product [Moneuplotes crassus]|uniref:histidine kinase n=1 Tax=Euplotes crassus TaxID=5936 RepID=A0AAD2D758_EUPCR|nr:unnamed protein product [Moneuplotes crassus]